MAVGGMDAPGGYFIILCRNSAECGKSRVDRVDVCLFSIELFQMHSTKTRSEGVEVAGMQRAQVCGNFATIINSNSVPFLSNISHSHSSYRTTSCSFQFRWKSGKNGNSEFSLPMQTSKFALS